MKKCSVVLAAFLVVLMVGIAQAQFVNGSFETGDFSGWTKGGGTWEETPLNSNTQVFTYSGDPGKSAIVTPGYDPKAGGTNLKTVIEGSYAARVNNSDPNYHFSTLTQTVKNWQDDTLYLAWAAVLLEPSNQHSQGAAPFFRVQIKDLTTNTLLYDKSYNVYNYPTWSNGIVESGEQWKYSGWQTAAFSTAGVKGDDLEFIAWGADCGWGGHGGYVYVDQIGSTPPIGTPEPATLILLGCALGGLYGIRRKVS